jgi:hypothetical protein
MAACGDSIHQTGFRMSDGRDWTVVLREPCEECGVDVKQFTEDNLAPALYESVDEWVELLSGNPTFLTARPAPTTWSPVEYGSHVADVMDLFQERIFVMLTEDNPTFPSWDPDIAAQHYTDRSPIQVSELLHGAANRLGDVWSTLVPHLWERTGSRADGASFTVLSLSQYFMHDNLHHLHDVRLGLASLG